MVNCYTAMDSKVRFSATRKTARAKAHAARLRIVRLMTAGFQLSSNSPSLKRKTNSECSLTLIHRNLPTGGTRILNPDSALVFLFQTAFVSVSQYLNRVPNRYRGPEIFQMRLQLRQTSDVPTRNHTRAGIDDGLCFLLA